MNHDMELCQTRNADLLGRSGIFSIDEEIPLNNSSRPDIALVMDVGLVDDPETARSARCRPR